MSEHIDWAQVTRYLDDLYTASDGLEQMFPGRKFTLDGHLVGSIGQVVAAYIFDLDLNPASTLGHDAKAPVLERVREAQHASHAVERCEQEMAIKRLQAEYDRLQKRVDAMYVDKLDGNIGGDFYERIAGQWREEQSRCLRNIERHQDAEQS